MSFLLTALFINYFPAHMRRLTRWSQHVHIAGGVIMIMMGVAMVTGKLGAFSYWLLDVFPALGSIGKGTSVKYSPRQIQDS